MQSYGTEVPNYFEISTRDPLKYIMGNPLRILFILFEKTNQNTCVLAVTLTKGRVKSGKFGRSAKFGQRPCLFHILIIGMKNK